MGVLQEGEELEDGKMRLQGRRVWVWKMSRREEEERRGRVRVRRMVRSVVKMVSGGLRHGIVQACRM